MQSAISGIVDGISGILKLALMTYGDFTGGKPRIFFAPNLMTAIAALPVEQRTWEWRACPALPTFSKQRFCELLRGNLLLVGDSLTGTFTKALTVLLEATVLSRTAGTSDFSNFGPAPYLFAQVSARKRHCSFSSQPTSSRSTRAGTS